MSRFYDRVCGGCGIGNDNRHDPKECEDCAIYNAIYNEGGDHEI